MADELEPIPEQYIKISVRNYVALLGAIVRIGEAVIRAQHGKADKTDADALQRDIDALRDIAGELMPPKP